MARFLSPLITEAVDGDEVRSILLQPLIYETDRVPGGLVITVPAGFVSDHSSVPRIPIAYWLTGGKGRRASVVHDWLYEGHGKTVGTVDAKGDGVFAPYDLALSRATADAIFFEALAITGYGPLTRWLMWLGVRLGGWYRWGQ